MICGFFISLELGAHTLETIFKQKILRLKPDGRDGTVTTLYDIYNK